MKKSEAYQWALIAVLHSDKIEDIGKLEVLKMLNEDKDLAIWREKKEEEEKNG